MNRPTHRLFRRDRRLLRLIGRSCALMAIMAHVGPAHASNLDESRLCDLAAARAAEATGVPIDLLLAITRVETGRGRGDGGADPFPWPWAINAGGEGTWFNDRSEAVAAAEAHLSDGSGNFDVGCFQLNIRWHGEAFATLDDMFDPESNARYAAGFLQQLYQESGDWKQAVAAYHSRTPDLAQAYVGRVKAVLEGPDAAAPEQWVETEIPAPRVNTFPLLQAGATGSAGSLVPEQAGRSPLFGGNS